MKPGDGMIDNEKKQDFERQVASFDLRTDEIETLGARAKAGDTEAAAGVAAAILHVACISPAASMAVMDSIVKGWFGAAATLPATPPNQMAALAHLGEAERPGAAFWDALWAFLDNQDGPTNGDEVTARVASLAANLPESFTGRSEAAAIAHPGAANAATRPLPPLLTLETLGSQPEGSLGYDYYRLIVDNDFNLEVLDREAIGLMEMPPAMRYLNIRILQMHDVWHLMGGYRTTVLQEVGISAFQLAQFGHNYSAMLIATAAAAGHFNSPEAFALVMQIIAEGWQHGRTTPSFMAIDWESEWHRPIAEIRAHYGIEAFASIYPADLVEQLRDAA